MPLNFVSRSADKRLTSRSLESMEGKEADEFFEDDQRRRQIASRARAIAHTHARTHAHVQGRYTVNKQATRIKKRKRLAFAASNGWQCPAEALQSLPKHKNTKKPIIVIAKTNRSKISRRTSAWSATAAVMAEVVSRI
jgi:hypothetical protein